jgi:tRNA pseudouridine55 synthase
MDGVLVIDKPPDVTSHDVVARTRHILHERRIGHTGTLDPLATGVLVVLVGRATRLAQFLSGVEKEYDAIIRLGYATETGDRTGKRIEEQVLSSTKNKRSLKSEEIQSAMASLTGEIEQVPPMYSAKKRGGKKLYELARKGEVVARDPVRVCIHEFRAIGAPGKMLKDNFDGTFDLEARIVCSTGTYVRTLAEDLGKRLGVGAHLAELRRTRVGEFDLSKAVTLEALKSSFGEEALGTVLLSPHAALSRLPFLHLTDDDARRARHGMEVKVEEVNWVDGATIRMCDPQGQLIAIGEFDARQKRLHPRVVLAE